jgi:hypothetical protein
MTYSGVLRKGTGEPLANADKILQLKLWPSAAPEGSELCAAGPIAVTTDNLGHFSVALDACLPVIKAHSDVFIEVIVGTVSLGTTKLGAVPYAVEAAHAVASDSAATADAARAAASITSSAIRVSKDCSYASGLYTDCSCTTDEVAIGGGGCSAGCSNNYTLAETTRIDEKAYVWRVSCSDSTGKRVRCSGESALCMKVSQ